MEFRTKYDYLKSSSNDLTCPREFAMELALTSIDRLRGNGTIFLAIDGKLSVILLGAESRNTFLKMGMRGNLKGAALEDYLILQEEQKNQELTIPENAMEDLRQCIEELEKAPGQESPKGIKQSLWGDYEFTLKN